MASAVPPPRQLAPTMGPAPVLAGVKIRTGNFIHTGERVVSGLVQRFDLWDYVSDNAGSFRKKAPPRNGVSINLGTHRVYVLEICARGNNKYSYYYIFVFMINVYIHAIIVLTRKH